MWPTVEAEVDVSGNVRLLEEVKITETSRALVTIIADGSVAPKKFSAASLLEFMRANRLPDEARPSVEEMEAQIEEARNSWD
jgi:hypothetical protein